MFFETAAAFGALSLYGYTTRRDLSAMGSFMMMGVFGLIIASVVNIFLHSTGLQWAMSVLGIGIFAGLTACDTQSIKESYYAGGAGAVAEKQSIFGRAEALSRLHQHVPVPADDVRRPPQLISGRDFSGPAARRAAGLFLLASCKS